MFVSLQISFIEVSSAPLDPLKIYSDIRMEMENALIPVRIVEDRTGKIRICPVRDLATMSSKEEKKKRGEKRGVPFEHPLAAIRDGGERNRVEDVGQFGRRKDISGSLVRANVTARSLSPDGYL